MLKATIPATCSGAIDMTTRMIDGDVLTIVGKSGEMLCSMEETFGPPRATMAVSGKITEEAIHDFLDELITLSLVSDNIVLDLSDTSFIAGRACEELVKVQRRYFDGKPHRSMVLFRCSDDVKSELSSLKLDKMLRFEE